MTKTTQQDYPGYRDPALGVLRNNKVRVWSDVKMETLDGSFEGLILPRADTGNPQHITLKLRTGYNIGINIDRIRSISELGYKKANYKIPEK